MTDLETYLYNVAKGRVHNLWFEDVSSADVWEKKVTIAANEKLAIISVLVTFQTTRQAEVGDPGSSGMDMCLSTGTTDATVIADSNKIVLFEDLECATEIIPVFMDFRGCPVMGLPGQHLHLQGHTTTAAKKPNAVVCYMVLPI